MRSPSKSSPKIRSATLRSRDPLTFVCDEPGADTVPGEVIRLVDPSSGAVRSVRVVQVDGVGNPEAFRAWVSPKQLAKRLDREPETVRRWVREGRLPAIRLPGRAMRIAEADVQAFLRSGGAESEDARKIEDHIHAARARLREARSRNRRPTS